MNRLAGRGLDRLARTRAVVQAVGPTHLRVNGHSLTIVSNVRRGSLEASALFLDRWLTLQAPTGGVRLAPDRSVRLDLLRAISRNQICENIVRRSTTLVTLSAPMKPTLNLIRVSVTEILSEILLRIRSPPVAVNYAPKYRPRCWPSRRIYVGAVRRRQAIDNDPVRGRSRHIQPSRRLTGRPVNTITLMSPDRWRHWHIQPFRQLTGFPVSTTTPTSPRTR